MTRESFEPPTEENIAKEAGIDELSPEDLAVLEELKVAREAAKATPETHEQEIELETATAELAQTVEKLEAASSRISTIELSDKDKLAAIAKIQRKIKFIDNIRNVFMSGTMGGGAFSITGGFSLAMAGIMQDRDFAAGAAGFGTVGLTVTFLAVKAERALGRISRGLDEKLSEAQSR